MKTKFEKGDLVCDKNGKLMIVFESPVAHAPKWIRCMCSKFPFSNSIRYFLPSDLYLISEDEFIFYKKFKNKVANKEKPTLTIERVPLQKKYMYGSLMRHFFSAMKKMKVNESFLMEKKYWTTFWCVKNDDELKYAHFITRKDDENNLRVFRIK